MKYILDSDTVIYFLKGVDSVVNKMATLDVANIYTTSINQAELYYGAANSQKVKANLRKLTLWTKLGNSFHLHTRG